MYKEINMANISINEFIKKFEENDRDFLRQDCYGFYDWFCADSSLERRARNLLPKLKFLVKHGIIDGDTTQVDFKNNFPMYGNTYDDMRFTVIETGEYLGLIAPVLGFWDGNLNGKCFVYRRKDTGDYDTNKMEFNSWMDFRKSIKDDKVLRRTISEHFYY
jgi:hypothetical protein